MRADEVGERDDQERHQKQSVNADEPAELRRIVALDIHEGLQDLHGRDRDDRGHQFLLQPAEIDLLHPVRPVAVAVALDARYEILVAGKNHDQYEISGEREIDQRQDTENNFGFGAGNRERDIMQKLDEEFHEQNGEARDQPEIERRHQPAAADDKPLDDFLDRPRYFLRAFCIFQAATPVPI